MGERSWCQSWTFLQHAAHHVRGRGGRHTAVSAEGWLESPFPGEACGSRGGGDLRPALLAGLILRTSHLSSFFPFGFGFLVLFCYFVFCFFVVQLKVSSVCSQTVGLTGTL